MRSLRRRKKVITLPEISLTPLIDTALTLLIIFMVTTPMMKDSLKISLPEIKNPGQKVNIQQNKLEIFISSKDKVQINEKVIEIKDITKHVKKYLESSRDKIIIVNGDKSVSYDSIIKILDIINSVEGEKYVALVCKRTNR